ncbi:MAG TPA: galactokinase [Planctomycetota bacterium]|nr:galactokinase [Planctomycetota bacterium]
MQQRIDQLRAVFAKTYGTTANLRISRAPGRVNLIGEHTDYNDGFVLPIAIDRDVLLAFRPNGSRTVNIHSVNFNQSVSFSLDDEAPDPAVQWLRYPFGVAKELQKHGCHVAGIDAAIEGNVPLGGGLSSSAAIEVAFALAFADASGSEFDRLTLAKLCRLAEHNYAGVKCGIMDQYVSLFAEKDKAVFIDCRSLTHELVPFRTDAVKLVVCDTGVRHSLAASQYNIRRAQCEEGAAFFAARIQNVKNLRDLSPADIEVFAAEMESPVLQRCRHVVTENARTLEAVKSLRRKNAHQFGILMSASHDSLKSDYEVTCKELDLMVNLADELKGVFGSRMTGGGFGGCVISLVGVEHVDAFCKAMAKGYEAATGIHPSIYVVAAEQGAQIL